jgi:hypothetical protein
MELNQVSYFINLAETLNFTAAARLRPGPFADWRKSSAGL